MKTFNDLQIGDKIYALHPKIDCIEAFTIVDTENHTRSTFYGPLDVIYLRIRHKGQRDHVLEICADYDLNSTSILAEDMWNSSSIFSPSLEGLSNVSKVSVDTLKAFLSTFEERERLCSESIDESKQEPNIRLYRYISLSSVSYRG